MPEIFGAALMGGGGVGATLTITGVAGDICNITGNGKTYTKTFDSSGQAVFKGLATGEYTVTMTDGEQTSTKTVTVTADYATAITYFAATISITYPATSTCTVANSSGETVASDTNTGTDAKTWTATVEAVDTYTITATATDGSKTKSATVEITAEGQVETVTLTYELVLIDNGTVNTALTGDWQATRYDAWDTGNTAPRVSIDSSGVNAYSGVGTYAAISHAKAFDVTSYSTLTIRMYAYQSRGTSIKVGLSTSNTGGDLAVALGQWGGSSKPTTGILDVSSLTGNYYFKAASGEQMTIGIQDIRLT